MYYSCKTWLCRPLCYNLCHNFHIFLFYYCYFYWIIVDLQCCGSFRNTAKWFSVIYVYVYTYACVHAKLLQSCLTWGKLCQDLGVEEGTVCELSLSVVSDSAAPWTVAHQGPRSMEFSRHEHWSGLPVSFSWGSSWPRDQARVSDVSWFGRWILHHRAMWEAQKKADLWSMIYLWAIKVMTSSRQLTIRISSLEKCPKL